MGAKVRYYLERPEPGKVCPVTLHYKFRRGNEDFIRLATTIEALAEHWDKKTQRLKEHLKPEYAELNQFLDDLANEAHRIVRTYRMERRLLQLTADQLKYYLRNWITGDDQPAKSKMSLKAYFEQFINNRQATKRKASIKQYKSTFNHFTAFCKRIKYEVQFEDVNLLLFEQFRNYFWELEPPQSDNNVHKHLRTFKLVLNEAVKREVTDNDKFRHIRICSDLNVCTCTADAIALYLPELHHLYKLDLPDNLAYTRDLFIIGCFTGLRVSDWSSIRPNKITEREGVETIPVWTKKTNKYVRIPIHPYVKAIFEKYNYDFPKQPKDQVINRHLKEIGKLAGFTEMVDLRNRYRGKWVTDEQPKYSLLVTHTARRSFATNAYLSGDIPQADIMAITVHSHPETFMKYVKLPKDKAAIKMAQSNFFKV